MVSDKMGADGSVPNRMPAISGQSCTECCEVMALKIELREYGHMAEAAGIARTLCFHAE